MKKLLGVVVFAAFLLPSMALAYGYDYGYTQPYYYQNSYQNSPYQYQQPTYSYSYPAQTYQQQLYSCNGYYSYSPCPTTYYYTYSYPSTYSYPTYYPQQTYYQQQYPTQYYAPYVNNSVSVYNGGYGYYW